MNHNSPIRNDKLLREAYEAGRRDALNEQARVRPRRLGSGGTPWTPASRSTGGGAVDHGAPRPPNYPDHLPWPPEVTPGTGPSVPPGPNVKPIPARDPVTGHVVGWWYCDEQPRGSGNWVWVYNGGGWGRQPGSSI